MTKTLVLGGGYVGNALVDKIVSVEFTHASVEKAKIHRGIYFRLEDQSSWQNLPTTQDVIWTFPAAPLDLIREFHETKLQNCKRLLVYGSTSCYLTSHDEETVTEDNPLDLTKERVKGEEYLRQKGATLLILSGIYGLGREPVNWLRNGRIRSLRKRVNLIHRNDIVDISLYLLTENSLPRGERINLADGCSRRWSEIAEHYSIPINDNTSAVGGKIISNTKLCRLLPGEFQFRSLY